MLFSSNGLSDVVPTSIGRYPSSLSWPNLNDNNFTGELPPELGNITPLQVLDLGNNEFSGNIPEWIGENLAYLVVLRLHKNNFTGRIPSSLCKISNLQILDVAHNDLTGPIAHCIGELKGMVKDRSMYNSLFVGYDYDAEVVQVTKGIELEYTTTLGFVINMDLSSNKLDGEIPVELTTLVVLMGLNLSNNYLSGRIPYNIGNIKALNSLDLSRNELNGTIPPSIASLNFLSSLNLSYNNLSGKIPTRNQLQVLTDPSSIYIGNKYLCGDPLPKKCSPHEDPTTTYHNKDRATKDTKKIWLYGLDIICGFATGFWGIIGILVEWKHKLFMFAEVIVDKIYVAVAVRVAIMKRGREVLNSQIYKKGNKSNQFMYSSSHDCSP